ncbi:ATP-binding cassette sub-family D member 4 [Nymphon striatum]|nr:ATP-binding cassette sub-family D member 4 [Nymphon striatum]
MVRALIEVLIRTVMCPGILIFYSYKSYKTCGVYALAGSYIYIFVSAVANTQLIAPIVKATTELEKWEGDYRFIHTQVRVNAEAIAFQSSEQIQWHQVNKKLNILCRVLQSVCNKTSVACLSVELFNQLQDVSAFIILSVAFLSGRFDGDSDSHLSALIAANHFYIFYLTSTFGDVISQYEQISQTAGTVHRIGELFEEMEIQAQMQSEEDKKSAGKEDSGNLYTHPVDDNGIMDIHRTQSVLKTVNLSAKAPGSVDHIISNMSFEFKVKENVLITGSGSCGKTTVLRLVKGLWKPSSGQIFKSNIFEFGISAVYFQPDTILLCEGTLKQLMVFPKVVSVEESESTENHVLERYMVLFGLQNLLDSFEGLTSEKCFNWQGKLSSNESKMVALVRILYHRPLVVAIDNIFSDMDLVDIRNFYKECSRLGMTVISVGDKNLLQEFHHKTIDLSVNRFNVFIHIKTFGKRRSAPIQGYGQSEKNNKAEGGNGRERPRNSHKQQAKL